MNVNLFKLLTSIGLWVVALGCGLLPIMMRNFHTNRLIISLSQCFAGGLFIAIGLIHILPEAREHLEGSWQKDGEEVFPLSYFICLVTFSGILLIDKVLFNNSDIIEGAEAQVDLRTSLVRKSFLGNREADPQENFQEMVSHNMKIALSMSRLNIEKNKDSSEEEEEDEYLEIPNDNLPANDRVNNADLKQESMPVNAQKESPAMQNQSQSMQLPQHDPHHDHNHDHKEHNHDHKKHDHQHVHKEDSRARKISDPNNKVAVVRHNHSHGHGHGKDHGHHHASVKKGASYMSAMVILTAMGIHGLFEGLAYGVSSTEEEVLNMFIAIAAHKWCDSLVVGISFVAAELPFKMALMLTCFLSLFTPLGILIGYLASENKMITGVFQALSAGTFLYISCAEIIIEEFAIADKKFWKFLMYALGILFIVIMGTLEH